MGAQRVFETGVFDTTVACAAATCLFCGIRSRTQRLRWLLIGAALGAWALGDVYWEAFLDGDPSAPYPSPADALYLAFYPLVAYALIGELRAGGRRLRMSITLDAVAGALVAAAGGAALLYPALRQATHGQPSAVATNLAYPLADILLIVVAAVCGGLAGTGIRGVWALVIAGLVCFVLADVAYLDRVARGTYEVGGLLDAGWPAGATTLALAAVWSRGRQESQVAVSRWFIALPPTAFAVAAAGILTVDHFRRANLFTLVLAATALGLVAVRMLIAFADNERLLRAHERDLLTDGLTGLPNRRALARELQRELALAGRRGGTTAVLMLDVDNFKYVNDTLGHQAGDRLIAAVAETLTASTRAGDYVARLGGDEFAVLLADAGRGDAEECARRILETLHEAHLITSAPRGHITASIGIAIVAAGEPLGWEHALARADAAMYDAKDAGRDTYAAHSSGTDSELIAERFNWSARIRDALDHDRLELHAQPIVDIRSGQLNARELLVRLRDRDGRLWPPGAFLPEAERFGMMPAIDRWVIVRAIALAADEKVGVNVSPGSIHDADTRAFILDAVRAARLPPDRLVFELTEQAAVQNVATAHAFATELQRLGCRLALDDFGVAFASFAHLKHLPFDAIKIDGSFIRSISSDRTDQVLVQAIVSAARQLGKTTVAEHVSDAASLELLAGMGVDYGQGYHLGAPQPVELPSARRLARAA